MIQKTEDVKKISEFSISVNTEKTPEFSLNSSRGRKDIDFIGIAEEAMP